MSPKNKILNEMTSKEVIDPNIDLVQANFDEFYQNIGSLTKCEESL